MLDKVQATVLTPAGDGDIALIVVVAAALLYSFLERVRTGTRP